MANEEKITILGGHAKQKPPPSPWRAYWRLLTYASPFDLGLRLCGIAAAAAAGSALPLMTIILGGFVQDFNDFNLRLIEPAKFRHAVNKNTLWLVYLFVGKLLTSYAGTVLHCITASSITRRVRLRYLETVLRQPISYFDCHTAGSVASSLSADTNLIEVGLAEKVAVAVESISMLCTAFVIAFAKSWRLTVVAATIIPYMIFTTGLLSFLNTRLEKKKRATYLVASGMVEEWLGSVSTVTALGAAEKVAARYREVIKECKTLGIKMGPLEAGMFGNMWFAMHSGYALALYYGIRLLNRHQIHDGGTLMTVLFSVVIGSSSMGLVAPSLPSFMKAASSAQQVLKVLDDAKSPDSGSARAHKLVPATVYGRLSLKNISFSYPARPTVRVLDKLSIEIPENQLTAVIGPSGCGKSTIVGLLERWYDPDAGSIHLDGANIQELDRDWLRGNIGLVQQEPMLFNDSIYENILNGLTTVRAEELRETEKRQLVIEACITADAHDFIAELPEGYDTRVGERSEFLSGGQKQRIAIARSIISNPQILLLDEATSALDLDSERAVQQALAKASRGRTTLMIAHKLSTIEHADTIIVMEGGRVAEQGTHGSLVAAGGLYARLLRAKDVVGNKAIKNPSALKVVREEISTSPQKSTPAKGLSKRAEDFKDATGLESKTISRKLSMIKCLYVILSEQRKIVPFFIGGLVGGTIAGCMMPVQAFLFSRLATIFQFQGSTLTAKADFWALMFFILGLAQLATYSLTWFLFSVAGAISSLKYRAEYLRGLLIQDISFFEATGTSSGGLTALLGLDGEEMDLMISLNLGLVIMFLIDLISNSVLALAIYWKLALVGVFICIPVLLVSGYLRMRLDREGQDRAAKFFIESARFSSEAVGAIRTIVSMTMESKVNDRYATRLKTAAASSLKRTMMSMLLFSLADSLDLLAMSLVFWYGGRLVSQHQLGVSAYFIVYGAVIFGGQSAGFVIGYTASITKAHASMNRMLYMKQKKPAINLQTGQDPCKLVNSTGIAIEFKHVNFRYPARPNVEILRDLNFKVQRGEKVCLTGPSGCGKSTVISLIERFYDVTGGEILFKGTNIRSLNIRAYRSIFGFVSQETSLYQGTLRDNLILGVFDCATITDEQLDAACRDANIYDFIVSLPGGYDTECGPHGQAFSGGQRQRIAIARALLRNPEILLLDEATSALDPENELLVRNALDRAATSGERTIINISHRLETMKAAEKIFVIDKGEVAEEGSFEELMERKGVLWEMMIQGDLT